MKGIGVVLGLLSDYGVSIGAFNKGVNQKITALELKNDRLHFTFENGYKMFIFDNGQSCCESRYMTTDDKLEDFIGFGSYNFVRRIHMRNTQRT